VGSSRYARVETFAWCALLFFVRRARRGRGGVVDGTGGERDGVRVGGSRRREKDARREWRANA